MTVHADGTLAAIAAAATPRVLFFEEGQSRAVLAGDYKLIHREIEAGCPSAGANSDAYYPAASEAEQFYDLSTDGAEQTNLLGDAGYAAQVAQLRDYLLCHRAATAVGAAPRFESCAQAPPAAPSTALPSPSPPPPSPLPLPPPPSPSPSLPPPPPSTGTVVLTLTASGSVSDYSDSDRSSLQQKVAAAAGVDKSLVTIRVAAASVRITATIIVPASTTADALQTSLASTLGTADAASTELGVAVEAVPTILIASPPPPPPPPGLPPPRLPTTTTTETASGLDTGIIAALVAGSLAGVGCASVALYLGCIRAKRLESKAPFKV